MNGEISGKNDPAVNCVEYIARKINCSWRELVNFAGGPKRATCILFFPSPLSFSFLPFRFFSVHRDLRPRSIPFRRGVPRMSSPEKARKSLHLPRAFCPYLERKYANLVSSKARRTPVFAGHNCTTALFVANFLTLRSYIVRNYCVINVTALPLLRR